MEQEKLKYQELSRYEIGTFQIGSKSQLPDFLCELLQRINDLESRVIELENQTYASEKL